MEDVPNYSIEETFEEDVEMNRVEEIFNILHLGGNDSSNCNDQNASWGQRKRQHFTNTKNQDALWPVV